MRTAAPAAAAPPAAFGCDCGAVLDDQAAVGLTTRGSCRCGRLAMAVGAWQNNDGALFSLKLLALKPQHVTQM